MTGGTRLPGLVNRHRRAASQLRARGACLGARGACLGGCGWRLGGCGVARPSIRAWACGAGQRRAG
jgi:hypothetical protein